MPPDFQNIAQVRAVCCPRGGALRRNVFSIAHVSSTTSVNCIPSLNVGADAFRDVNREGITKQEKNVTKSD